MAMLGQVEAKSLRGRLIHGGIILTLTLGGLSMVYPFAIMVSGSLRSEMDSADFDLAPDYLTDDAAVYRKFLETKYNQDATLLNRTHLASHTSFRTPDPPAEPDPSTRQDVDRLRAYLADPDLPIHWQNLGGVVGVNTVPEHLRELRSRLSDQFEGSLDALGRAMDAPIDSWHSVGIIHPEWLLQRYDYDDNPLYQTYFAMLRESDPAHRLPVSVTGVFLQNIVYPRYGSVSTDAFNSAHRIGIDRYGDFRLPATIPGEDQPTLRAEWIEFVLEELNPSFVVANGATQAEYNQLQRAVNGGSAFQLPDGRRWLGGEERQVYARFIETVPPETLRIVGPEYELAGLSIPDVMPRMEHDYAVAHAGKLRWDFATRNYRHVFDELVFQGRPLFNTVVYCSLSVIVALLANPLAAYAMSRFKLPGTYRVLLILVATISFPPMVTLIPQFILLRKLDLLNTFAALVLPLVANGYMIFLLKGFFDSLPRELYESARIDGAGEMRMFFQFTMSLSKPILAVLALGTFTSAYTAFLYPLLVAPDQDMWLISVWLFQFQQRASSPAIYASVLVASIPTLIIFLFAQRTIMRGIVVPSEK